MAHYILGIDEGTTGARAFVIDDQCAVLSLASAELTRHYPRAGWIEHDPMEIRAARELTKGWVRNIPGQV